MFLNSLTSRQGLVMLQLLTTPPPLGKDTHLPHGRDTPIKRAGAMIILSNLVVLERGVASHQGI